MPVQVILLEALFQRFIYKKITGGGSHKNTILQQKLKKHAEVKNLVAMTILKRNQRIFLLAGSSVCKFARE